MSNGTECPDPVESNVPNLPVPFFSNPDVLYPRLTGLDASYADVPMGVQGDERTKDFDGPVAAARAIDEAWDVVASISEGHLERLPNSCNEGDIPTDVLSSRLPGRASVAFGDGGQVYRLPLSGPAVCVDGLSLTANSSRASFDVMTSDRLSGAHRLSVVATEPHDGACVSVRRAVVTATLWDAVNEFPPEVIRQRVPGVSPAQLVAEQRSAHSFCKGAPARHHLQRLGDFDGDGRADALLRHADGHWLYQPMDELGARAGGAASLNNNPAVSVAGVGDFNGDGRDDVLMRRAGGSWRTYLMDGRRSIAGGGSVALPSDGGWQVEGIGDFNRDGRDDVLLRRSDGNWQIHHMDGRMVLSSYSFRPRRDDDFPAGWVAGVGDFDGSGSNDLLWHLADGTWHLYSNFSWSSNSKVSLPGDTGWAVAGVADFNGDGKADVLLRHEDGRWRYYAMDGQAIVEEAVPALPADPFVWLAGVGDTDGDGKADVLTRRAYGAWRVYRMDGGRVTGEAEVGLASESGWGVLTSGAVAPVEATALLPAQPLALGTDTTVDLPEHFADDQPLSYHVLSTEEDVVRASAAGNALTLTPVAFGRATVTVTAHDPDGNAAVQGFSVVVSDDGRDAGAAPQAGNAGRRFRDCAECPEMAVVPVGFFMMGAPANEAGSFADERPRHGVEFAAPFAIGAYEATNEQWNACAEAGGCTPVTNPGALSDHRRRTIPYRKDEPIIQVSWHEAAAFVGWLSARTGQAYRLPSEAEWEYATRAGTRTPYHFGNMLIGEANHAGKKHGEETPDLCRPTVCGFVCAKRLGPARRLRQRRGVDAGLLERHLHRCAHGWWCLGGRRLRKARGPRWALCG